MSVINTHVVRPGRHYYAHKMLFLEENYHRYTEVGQPNSRNYFHIWADIVHPDREATTDVFVIPN